MASDWRQDFSRNVFGSFRLIVVVERERQRGKKPEQSSPDRTGSSTQRATSFSYVFVCLFRSSFFGEGAAHLPFHYDHYQNL